MTDACILIVEDEMYLAMMLEDLLADAGYRVLRAARLQDAMDLADREHVDGAILDVNLNGVAVYPLAALLHEHGVPFMFASAYGKPGIPEEYSEYPVMPKPYPIHGLVPAVADLLEGPHAGRLRQNPGSVSPSAPRG